jgi:hypothetical protein
MVKRGVLLSQGARHAWGQCSAVAILKRPHALQVKQGHPVIVLQPLFQIGLKARHGTQLAVDEGDTALLSGQV